jgi:uncharacterized membrane protein
MFDLTSQISFNGVIINMGFIIAIRVITTGFYATVLGIFYKRMT